MSRPAARAGTPPPPGGPPPPAPPLSCLNNERLAQPDCPPRALPRGKGRLLLLSWSSRTRHPRKIRAMTDQVIADARLAVPLWPHQERALAAFGTGERSTYLVVPPGGGKTLIGLEAARRTGRKTLVLCPNTAIQAQWIGQWQAAFAPPPDARATASRDLPTPLTVLTYQAVASFDASAESSPADRRAPDHDLLAT